MAKELLETQVKIGPVRFSYANVFKARAFDEDDDENAKYSVTILLPKTEKLLVKQVKAAIAAAVEQGKGKWGGKIPKNLKLPLRDGDEEKEDDENYSGMWFFTASSKRKPGVVRKVGDEFEAITEDDDLFYSGCWGRVFLNFFPYNMKSKGVAAGLNHIQKTRDDERLSGGISAEDAFDDEWEDEEAEETAPKKKLKKKKPVDDDNDDDDLI